MFERWKRPWKNYEGPTIISDQKWKKLGYALLALDFKNVGTVSIVKAFVSEYNSRDTKTLFPFAKMDTQSWNRRAHIVFEKKLEVSRI